MAAGFNEWWKAYRELVHSLMEYREVAEAAWSAAVDSQTSTNSEYAAALRVIEEYVNDDGADSCKISDMVLWCRQRLNTPGASTGA